MICKLSQTHKLKITVKHMQSLKKKNEKHFPFIKMKYRIEGIKKKVIKE